MYKSFGGDVINMTTVPEVKTLMGESYFLEHFWIDQVSLSKEAGISYVAVAMVTDYDCWKAGTEPVSVEQVH